YEVTRKCAGKARAKDIHLLDVLLKDKAVKKHLTAKAIRKTMDPANYLGASKKIVANVVKGLRD
ncbi:MAG: adenylosuccinate lyase, partial [Thermoplasmata archaeon]|nr:adenylosuccinate lyase [Thermoplasmata archaeon]